MEWYIYLLYAVSGVLLISATGLFTVTNKHAKRMALITAFETSWVLFVALFLVSTDEKLSLFFANGFYISALFIPVLFIVFVDSYSTKLKPVIKWLLASVPAILAISLLFEHNTIVKSITISSSTDRMVELNTVNYVIYIVYFIACFSAGLALLLKSITSKAIHKRRSRDLRLILVLAVIGGIAGAWFDLALPLVGSYNFIWVGTLGGLVFLPIAYRTATTGEYFSAVKTFFRGFIIFMIGVLSIAGCLAALTIMAAIIGPGYALNWNHYVVGTLVLVISLIWIFVLWKFGKRIIKRVDSAGYDETEVLRSMSKIAAEKHGFSEFFSAVRHTLDKAFGVKFVDIIVFGQDTAVHVADGNLESVLQHLATHANNKKNETIYRGDVRNESAYVALVAHDIEVITPIVGTMDSAVIGVIILSSRRRRYDRYYGETLAKVSAILSPFIQSAVYYEQIIDFNAKLKHEVRVKTKELRESNKELQKVDELKDDLLSIASHQLRTPLTGVIGYADMLHEGDFGRLKPAQLEILDRIVKSGKRMSQTLTDFLNVTRIDTGRLVLRKDPVNLSELVQDEIESLKDLAASRDRELIYSHDNSDANVVGDETNLRQVVLNLIDNAIYYGKKRIEIGLHVVDGEAIFTVRDDGIGVSKTDQAKLFTKMFRAENAKTIRPDGSGIGLYAIKNIIEDSGGEIIFESAENEGSTFGFRMRVRSEIAKNSPENA